MHNYIYQINTKPIYEDDFITPSDFYDHWFTNSIANYVSEDVNRQRDWKEFKEHLEGQRIAMFNNKNYSFTLLPDSKELYFRSRYDSFIGYCKESSKINFDYFCNDAEISLLLHKIESYCYDRFGCYVTSDEFNTISFDEFMRMAEVDKPYFIGGILDYHY